MEKTGLTSGRLGLLVAAAILVVVVYQVVGRGCTISAINVESGISFACGEKADNAPAASTAEPPAPARSAAANAAGIAPPRAATVETPPAAPPTRPETPPARPENSGAKLSTLAGEWRNVDAATRGLTRLVVAENPATVHAWGRCHPSDCDWGAVPASAFRQTVDGGAEAALQAHFRTGFDETTLIITPVGAGQLRVETLTHFTDNSGRADYSASDQFQRAGS